MRYLFSLLLIIFCLPLIVASQNKLGYYVTYHERNGTLFKVTAYEVYGDLIAPIENHILPFQQSILDNDSFRKQFFSKVEWSNGFHQTQNPDSAVFNSMKGYEKIAKYYKVSNYKLHVTPDGKALAYVTDKKGAIVASYDYVQDPDNALLDSWFKQFYSEVQKQLTEDGYTIEKTANISKSPTKWPDNSYPDDGENALFGAADYNKPKEVMLILFGPNMSGIFAKKNPNTNKFETSNMEHVTIREDLEKQKVVSYRKRAAVNTPFYIMPVGRGFGKVMAIIATKKME